MAAEQVQHMLPPNLVPGFLKDKKGWVVWRYEKGEGPKPRKIPYYADGTRRRGVQGSTEDRSNLADFETAFAQYRTNQWSGIGFAMLPDWGLVGADFDHCVSDGVVDPRVSALLDGTYAEISPSGTGVRAFFTGSLTDKKEHASGDMYGMEIFCNKGFLTITGNHLPHVALLGPEANPLTPTITAEYARRFPRPADAPTPASDGTLTEAANLLKRVSPDCTYAEWLSVGMALHHQSHGSPSGLALWDSWSIRSGKYPPDGFSVLDTKWQSFGIAEGRPTTINTIRRLASVATADDFDTPTDPTRFAVRSLSEFDDRPPLTWFIKQVVPQAGMGVVFGESGSGKTFFVTDLALAIATGTQWREHRTKQARVVYVCAEGFNGFLNRLRACQKYKNFDFNGADFGIISDVPNLLQNDHIQLSEQILASGGAGVVIIDTFAQVTPGANENGAEDMGKALGHCRAIHEATGALVLLVHHAGKDSSKGARGWSGIKAAADVEIEITRNGDARCARVSKLKDAEDGGEYYFSLQQVLLGADEDGDPITSCVLDAIEKPGVEAEDSEGEAGAGGFVGAGNGGGSRRAPLDPTKPRGAWEALVYSVVSRMGGDGGMAVSCDAVRAEALSQSPSVEGRDRRNDQITRALCALREKGAVLLKNNTVRVNLQDIAI